MASALQRPKIAVAALNPHAGEGGLFGRQDIDVSEPTIAKAVTDGLNIVGPVPGATVFVKLRWSVRRRDRDVSRPGSHPDRAAWLRGRSRHRPLAGAFRRQHHARAADYSHRRSPTALPSISPVRASPMSAV